MRQTVRDKTVANRAGASEAILGRSEDRYSDPHVDDNFGVVEGARDDTSLLTLPPGITARYDSK